MQDDVLAEECWSVDCAAVAVAVRQRARQLALDFGLDAKAVAAVTIAVSELANNIVDHAGVGQIVIRIVHNEARRALVAIARDHGPGIANIDWALTDGCSSTGGMGCGLPAVIRLMHEFHIDSVVGRGTVITVRRWLEETNAGVQRRPDGNARS